MLHRNAADLQHQLPLPGLIEADGAELADVERIARRTRVVVRSTT